MIEKEISEIYYFNPDDFNESGRSIRGGCTFRDLIKDYEIDFHNRHTTEYALNLYGNSQTMNLLARSCNAAPFLLYGMDLTQGEAFDAVKDPYINHQMDSHSKYIFVYGIDSAFMTDYDEYGYPELNEDSGIYPLTLLIDSTMGNGVVRLAVPSLDDDDTETVIIDVPKFEYA